MPSGPAHLHRRFGDDGTAWAYLKRRGFHCHRGIILPPYRWYDATKGEWDAILYLVQEWDWDYDWLMAPDGPPAASPLYRAVRTVRRASAGPLRVWDKHWTRLQMWYYCVARYNVRKWWYIGTGRRKMWEGDPFEGGEDIRW